MSVSILYLASYLLGAFPSAFLLSKIFFGKDIREMGSGNMGATNMARCLGKSVSVCTLLLDISKTILVLLLVQKYYLDDMFVTSIAAIMVMLGHIFPIYLKFKGGKGVANALAIISFISWQFAVIFVSVWLLVFLWKRTSSISSITAMICTTSFSYYQYSEYKPLLLIMTLIIIVSHRKNIINVVRNNEQSFSKKV